LVSGTREKSIQITAAACDNGLMIMACGSRRIGLNGTLFQNVKKQNGRITIKHFPPVARVFVGLMGLLSACTTAHAVDLTYGSYLPPQHLVNEFGIKAANDELKPPVGMNVYVIKSVSDVNVSLETIFHGAGLFLLCEILIVTLLIVFPSLSTFLPSSMD
jgi:hypothetical protein